VRVKPLALGDSLRRAMRILGRNHKRIRAFPSTSVTRRSEREVDPRSVGVRAQDVEAIWSAVVSFYEAGLHPALGLWILRTALRTGIWPHRADEHHGLGGSGA